MALPTASLGQLPSLNMPYQIPTYEVRRGRDQILTAMLAQMGAALGTNLVENSLSRDYAAEMGQKPAGFWSRLVNGPVADRKQFEAYNTRTEAGRQADLDRTQRSNMADTEANIANRRIDTSVADAAAARELQRTLEGDRLKQARQQMLYEGTLRQQLSGQGAKDRLSEIDRQAGWQARIRADDRANEQAMAWWKQASDEDKLRLQAELEANSPQGQYYKSNAARQDMANEVMRRQLGGGNNQPQAAATPSAQPDNALTTAAQKFLAGEGRDVIAAAPSDEQAMIQRYLGFSPGMETGTLSALPDMVKSAAGAMGRAAMMPIVPPAGMIDGFMQQFQGMRVPANSPVVETITPIPIDTSSVPRSEALAQLTGAPATPGQPDLRALEAIKVLMRNSIFNSTRPIDYSRQ